MSPVYRWWWRGKIGTRGRWRRIWWMRARCGRRRERIIFPVIWIALVADIRATRSGRGRTISRTAEILSLNRRRWTWRRVKWIPQQRLWVTWATPWVQIWHSNRISVPNWFWWKRCSRRILARIRSRLSESAETKIHTISKKFLSPSCLNLQSATLYLELSRLAINGTEKYKVKVPVVFEALWVRWTFFTSHKKLSN